MFLYIKITGKNMRTVDNSQNTQKIFTGNTKKVTKTIKFGNRCDHFEKTTQSDTNQGTKFEFAKQFKKLGEILSLWNSVKEKISDNREATAEQSVQCDTTGNNNGILKNTPDNVVLNATGSSDLISSKTDVSEMTYEKRIKSLTEKGVDLSVAKQISKFDEPKYTMFCHLINDNNYDASNPELTSVLLHLNNNQCIRFNELHEMGLGYEDAFNGMSLNDETQAKKYASLIKNGVKSYTAINAVKLDDTHYERFLYFINSGSSGSEALDLIDLDIEQYQKYKYLIQNTVISLEDARNAVKLDNETQFPKFIALTEKGVFAAIAIEGSKLNEEQYAKFETLVDKKTNNSDKYKNVAEGILLKIATMNTETEYPKFEKLCNKGVDVTIAANAITMLNKSEYSRFETLIDNNINPFFAFNAARLEKSEFKRFLAFKEKGINSDSALELAQILKDDYSHLNLKEKTDISEKLKRIQKYYANDEEETKILNLNTEIEKVENSMKQVISAPAVSKARAITMMKEFFANNNLKSENTLSTADLGKYGKEGIPLTYSRTEFLNDLSTELRKLPAETQAKITEKLGIDVIKDGNGNITGYNGIIDLTKLSNDTDEKNILIIANKFIYENTVKTGNIELDTLLNSLIQGMPEFINVIGKKQHATHAMSVDCHILTVLGNVLNNPEYKNLSDTDKFCLKFATVLHDIAKSERIVDENHANFSALYARDILKKYNIPSETKNRICEFIKNHHWLAEYNKCSITADEVAAMFRRTDDITSARILAEADLKGVSNEFFKAHKIVLDSSIQEPISDALININSKGEIFLTNSIIDKSIIPTINYNGKTYKVINFSELSKNTDLAQYGFEPNTTLDNFRVLVHTIKEKDIKQNLENVLMLGDSANEGFLCASFISNSNKNTYHDNKYGVVLNTENVNIANASKVNQNSGFEKGFKNFSNIITGNARESVYRDNTSRNIKKNLNLTDNEYAKLYTILQKFKHASQLDNISSITVGDKTFTGAQIKNAIISSNNSIINARFHNEVNVYTPQISAVMAKVNSIDEVPQELSDFANEHNLPIFLF